MSSRSRAFFVAALGVARDACLIVGVTAILIIGLEVAYRTEGAVKAIFVPHKSGEGANRPDHPYRGEAWWPVFVHVRDDPVAGRSEVYDPYRGWWLRPLNSPSFVIDSAGRRRTVQAVPKPGSHPREVFMFGGSAMWGHTVRDSSTLPSLIAARLAARGYDDVVVVNYGSPAYNATQALITLELELRAGHVPVAAVFLDGINEVGPVNQGGRPGEVFGQQGAEQLFERRHPSFGRDAVALSKDIQFVERLRQVVKPVREVSVPLKPADCREIGVQYRNLAEMASALGKQYGFQVLSFWQPTLEATGKPLTSWERYILDTNKPLASSMRACTATVDSSVAGAQPPIHFEDLSPVLDGYTGTAFVDMWGHFTERASPTVADHIFQSLVPLLDEAKSVRRR